MERTRRILYLLAILCAEGLVARPTPATLQDAFGAPAIDEDRWDIMQYGVGPTIAQQAGQLRIDLLGTSSEDPIRQDFEAGLLTKCILQGDFDARAVFALQQWPPQSGVRVGITAYPTNDRLNFIAVSERLSIFFTNGEEYVADFHNGGILGGIVTTDFAGSLRLSRVGPTVTASYLSGGQWQVIGTSMESGEDVRIALRAWSHDYLFGNSDVTVAFDDFQADAGSILCPTTTTTTLLMTTTTLQATTTSTSTTTTTLVGCGTAPRSDCIQPANAKVTIRETIPGHERLKITLKSLVPPVAQIQFGNPVTGNTRYDICVYDDALQLVADLTVDRAAQVCGNSPKPCWRQVSDKGYRYADSDAAADGMQKIVAKGGPAGRGKVVVKAGNNAANGQSTMPVGITAALEGTKSVTIQVSTTDADCFAATFMDIESAESALFKAVAGP